MCNYKVLNDKPNEQEIDNCKGHNKDTCPLPNSCQTKSIIYQANVDCNIAVYKQKCCLGLCEATFVKERFGNHKKSFNPNKHENKKDYQKNFGQSKIAMEHQKLYGK